MNCSSAIGSFICVDDDPNRMRRGQVPTLCANPHEQICSLASAGEEGFNPTALVLVLVLVLASAAPSRRYSGRM
jgi:hypothetical protein